MIIKEVRNEEWGAMSIVPKYAKGKAEIMKKQGISLKKKQMGTFCIWKLYFLKLTEEEKYKNQ